jgi:hypothetical protein
MVLFLNLIVQILSFDDESIRGEETIILLPQSRLWQRTIALATQSFVVIPI